MCFMAVRLLEMRATAQTNGIDLSSLRSSRQSLPQSCNGRDFWLARNFVNVLWLYKTGGMSKRWLDASPILCEGTEYVFNPQREKSYLSHNLQCHDFARWRKASTRWSECATIGTSHGVAGESTRDRRLSDAEARCSVRAYDLGQSTMVILCSTHSAGCATTLVAAERMQRQWAGMDIWEGAPACHRASPKHHGTIWRSDIHRQSPTRTDDGETGAPFLRVKEQIREPEGQKMSRAEMYDFLLRNMARSVKASTACSTIPATLNWIITRRASDGGINHISNRILLCSPCNRLKSNTHTSRATAGEQAQGLHGDRKCGVSRPWN